MKGQIKMFETIGVLVVFFFLLGAASIFYFNIKTSSLEKQEVKANEQFAFQIAIKALHLPELDCSFLASRKDNCIDIYKMAALKEQMSDESWFSDYFELFGHATIKIKEVYPGGEEMILYSSIPTDEYSDLTSISPILLFDSWREEYRFGIMEVRVHV